jgi:hypothetical protein
MTVLRRAARRLLGPFPRDYELHAGVDRLRFSIGSLQAVHARQATTLRDAEFRCFSQFGEDGIIQWLIARVPIEREVFVEFGVGEYVESCTRFLLEHDNWRGLILGSGSAHLEYLASTDLRWRFAVTARTAFITRDNIDELLAPVAGDIGLLSIDINGNDYWVWEAITVVSPRIVVIEYNGIFGTKRPVTVPYDARFDRTAAHYSRLYWGASLPALLKLAKRKAYRLVGSNSNGHNAFFVREDVAGDLPALTAADGWRESRFRESRDRSGGFTYLESHAERRAVIADMPLLDVATGEMLTVRDCDEMEPA